MFFEDFHPAVAALVRAARSPAPTAAQVAAWPAIHAGRHTLVAAPTGSGKTLAAFLAAHRRAGARGPAPGGLPTRPRVVYVSPLKALSNDIRLNLEAPLAGIRAELRALGLPDVEIRTAVRTGDTPQARARSACASAPPHILVTTPESLYILLGSESGRAMLATARTVIVDEIHARRREQARQPPRAVARAARGAVRAPLVRIGLSATQKPIDEVARFLVGDRQRCRRRSRLRRSSTPATRAQRDLALELPPSPLEAVMSNDAWEQVYDRLAELVARAPHDADLRQHAAHGRARRAPSRRAARQGGRRRAPRQPRAEHRLDAEQRLKRGELKALVATASLELGIDIGDVDLVCQLGSPRSIAAFLQRVGRSGHAVGGDAEGRGCSRCRATSWSNAPRCSTACGAASSTRCASPPAPLDVLAQQIVAEVALPRVGRGRRCSRWCGAPGRIAR